MSRLQGNTSAALTVGEVVGNQGFRGASYPEPETLFPLVHGKPFGTANSARTREVLPSPFRPTSPPDRPLGPQKGRILRSGLMPPRHLTAGKPVIKASKRDTDLRCSRTHLRLFNFSTRPAMAHIAQRFGSALAGDSRSLDSARRRARTSAWIWHRPPP